MFQLLQVSDQKYILINTIETSFFVLKLVMFRTENIFLSTYIHKYLINEIERW